MGRRNSKHRKRPSDVAPEPTGDETRSTVRSFSRSQSGSRSRSQSVDRYKARSLSRSSLSRRGSVVSQESVLNEGNNNEIYSGAGSEIIPSSITSFHYPHSFGSRRHQSAASAETSPLLHTREDVESVKSYGTNASNDEAANFKFFKLEEIESAPGGSTYENPEEIVDYNTDWVYPIDKYGAQDIENENPIFEEDDGDDQRSYGSSEFERRRRSSGSSRGSSEELLNDLEDEAEREEFEYKSEYQRYYLAEEDLVIGIAGYQNNILKQTMYYLLCTITLGMAYLVLRWLPRYRINLIGDPCPLGKADWCVVENEYGELSVVDIEKKRLNQRLSSFLNISDDKDDGEVNHQISDPIIGHMHTFKYRYLKFFYNPVEDIFKTNNNWFDQSWTNSNKIADGVPQSLFEERAMIFEENSIEIDDKPILSLLLEEVLHPFYVFQIFSILLWLVDDYFYYASCIFIISMISIVNTLVETQSTMKKLKSISIFNCEVRVWRNEFWKTVLSNELVPGDIFEVDPSLNAMPCDCLLINGEVIVNESMLTGESVPVTKSCLQDEQLELIKDNINVNLPKSYLYNGTKILKRKSHNDEPVKALVVKTGFNTTKGSLIRSMLFPKPIGFKFYQDSFKYIGFMSFIAFTGFIYSTVNFIKLGVPKSLMILRALDIITIVVPPALPATLTIGTTFAINRLKSYQIYCISPTRVNIGGKLDVICFDKTGTLTEDGLDVLGVHLVNNAVGRKEMKFDTLARGIEDIVINRSSVHDSNNGPLLVALMSTCHSLRKIDDDILGDPLDYKMFEFTDSNLKDSEMPIIENYYGHYRILKELEFESNIRRMSVVVETNHSRLVLCKGAPEVMVDICTKQSIPEDFFDLLHKYTNSGYRVIACAYKPIRSKVDMNRESLESNMQFLGFIVFENKLKANSAPTIHHLHDAKIRTIMCTGDNILTAISVGKECGILEKEEAIYVPRFTENPEADELVWENINDPGILLDSTTLNPLSIKDYDYKYKFAITGKFFKYLLTNFKDHESFQQVLLYCDIFARMSPDEKHELVNQLQKIDYTVGFIGDGANDCGALKAANVGVSLSEAEASIAAPFTSRVFEVSCLLDVIREGRASLVTSFSSFKFMSLYSAIQFITVTILYKRGTNLGDFQFLYIDMILILPLAIFMSWSQANKRIIPKRPSANLVSPRILVSLVGNIVILLIFQVILWRMIQREPWYVVPVPGDDENVKSFDNSVLFLFSNLQYIVVSLLLAEGPPYREPLHKNVPYVMTVIASVAVSCGLFLIDSDGSLGNIFQLVNLPTQYYVIIMVMSAINYGVLYVMRRWVYGSIHAAYKRVLGSRHSKKAYKNMQKRVVSV
ncbi:hypothetical protein PSN45_002982 [Yamadazyma tenuis]|uniref:Cation-transporting ATPase n=1 Tax=Candida tenuis (strain ATCC 10573 / BCRC 21748 / CBS 615 / JCM 9827 / NBRC 10315 / NRRL Y-1498 / VKM Y-70) TaxID=590646 RepID=G3AW06_CANTC|nr:uncharacterized protein CANTEDRAFT_100886 [Yamadazyma tenuis ATCC 10573]EGV66420.1 hypothetical protein CANTEDRAFT_100886 [Yamadazyma tenuis ATCC 10573]WEJ95462.1 hypothetical protein PSN45_002982 [Yamadazyma tenuis]